MGYETPESKTNIRRDSTDENEKFSIFMNILESGFGFINEIIMSFRLSRGPNVTEVPSFTIKISNHVYQYCFQHALSTQTEEIMGLLIGEMKEEEDVMEIVSLRINRRLDKRPDRVEISPDQMINATLAAEKLAEELNRPNIRGE